MEPESKGKVVQPPWQIATSTVSDIFELQVGPESDGNWMIKMGWGLSLKIQFHLMPGQTTLDQFNWAQLVKLNRRPLPQQLKVRMRPTRMRVFILVQESLIKVM